MNKSHTRPYCIGITGGIASGKSSVCHLFETLGAPVVDADIAAREVVKPGTPGLAEITSTFGKHILDEQHQLDRKALRSIIFADPDKRKALEAITHPRIRAWMWQQVAQCQFVYCLLAVPLLIEGGMDKMVDRVLVVDIDPKIQRERLKNRDGSSDQEIDSILKAQLSREQRLFVADDVIDNNAGIEQLEPQAQVLHQQYLLLAQAHYAKQIDSD